MRLSRLWTPVKSNCFGSSRDWSSFLQPIGYFEPCPSEKMSETRPVPRRESPWGTPEGEHRQPKAHRCNDRAEDVIQACFEGNPFKTVPGPFKLFWKCMRSKPGEEPTEPYTYLQLDPPKRETKLE